MVPHSQVLAEQERKEAEQEVATRTVKRVPPDFIVIF